MATARGLPSYLSETLGVCLARAFGKFFSNRVAACARSPTPRAFSADREERSSSRFLVGLDGPLDADVRARLIQTALRPAAMAPSTSRERLSPIITAPLPSAPRRDSACRMIAGSGLPVPNSADTTTAANRSPSPDTESFSRCRHDAPLVIRPSAYDSLSLISIGTTSPNTWCRARRSSPKRCPSSSASATSCTSCSASGSLHASRR